MSTQVWPNATGRGYVVSRDTIGDGLQTMKVVRAQQAAVAYAEKLCGVSLIRCNPCGAHVEPTRGGKCPECREKL